MSKLSERIMSCDNKIAKLEQTRKELSHKQEEETKKINQRRNFIVGELVCRYFPQLLELTPGTKQENAETFRDFELFLKALSDDKEQLTQLWERVNRSKGILT